MIKIPESLSTNLNGHFFIKVLNKSPMNDNSMILIMKLSTTTLTNKMMASNMPKFMAGENVF